MRLRDDLPPTDFGFPRGVGEDSIPLTGDANKPPSAVWWTKEDALQEAALEFRKGKIFLGRIDDKPIGYIDDRHIVTLAGTRGGKSASMLMPNLMLYPGSALVIDPKGELANATAAHRASALGHDVHVLDPWHQADKISPELRSTFDPLAELLDHPDDIIDNADLIADALIIQAGKDPHWTNAARALVRAIVLWLALDRQSYDGAFANLPRIVADFAAESARHANGGKSVKAGALAMLAKLKLDDFAEGDRDAAGIIRTQAELMLGPNQTELASIFSTARTQMAFLESPAMARSMAASTLRLSHLKSRPTTIYLCMPAARMGTHSRWLRLLVNLAVAALETAKFPNGGRGYPVLFVLEEFAALGTLEALEKAVAYMAGYGVKLWAVLQDLTQLKRHYKEGWETFLGNAGCLQAFAVSDQTTCEYLSKRLGETTFQFTNKIEVGSKGNLDGDLGLRREFKTAPLLTPDELARKLARYADGKGGTKGGLALVLCAGAHPFIVDRVFHSEIEYVDD